MNSHYFYFQERKARKAILELDIATLYADNGMKKLYEKLDTLFFEDNEPVSFYGIWFFRE